MHVFVCLFTHHPGVHSRHGVTKHNFHFGSRLPLQYQPLLAIASVLEKCLA